jgi:hypothetical protein
MTIRLYKVRIVAMVALGAAMLAACSDRSPVESSRDLFTASRSAYEALGLGAPVHRLRPGVDSVAIARLLAKLPAGTRAAAHAAFEQRVGAAMTLHSEQADVQADIDGIVRGETVYAEAHRKLGKPIWNRPISVLLVSGGTPIVRVWSAKLGGRAEYIVVSDSAATPQLLSAALRYVARSRSSGRPIPGGYVELHPRASATTRLPSSWYSYLTNEITLLRAQPIGTVTGIGTGRLLTISSVGQ